MVMIRDQHPHPKMENLQESKQQRDNNMKPTNYLCMPKFKLTTASPAVTCGGRNNRRLSPMSLLDRIREAMFRLIMLSSALSKAAHQTTGDHHRSGGGDEDNDARRCCYNYLHDPRHSEAVADCIEFIKKSATMAEEGRESTASTTSSSSDAATDHEVVFPVPVM